MKHSHDFDFKLSFTKTGRPYIVVDNFLTSEEYDVVMEELDTTIRPHMRRDETGGALGPDGKPLKNSNACFVNDVFEDASKSSTFVIMQKFFTDQNFVEKLVKSHWAFDWFDKYGVEEVVQFLYYDQKDNYGSHVDTMDTTALLWLCKEPKGFEGGDFIIEDTEKVEFKNNRMVIFKFGTYHGVETINRTSDLDGHGRYCVSKAMRPAA